MAFDVYVGPLCRYHALNWETAGQRAAREAGAPMIVLRTDASPQVEEEVPQDEVTRVVEIWQEHLVKFVESHGAKNAGWREDPELPYATDRPGWEGYAALIFKTAYLMAPSLPEPTEIPDFSAVDNDPAFKQNADDLAFLAQVELWLPGEFMFRFEFETITGAKVWISSLAHLNAILDWVCERWGKDRLVLQSMSTDQPSSRDTLNAAALHGLTVFCRLADFARKQHMPMILDY